AAGSTKSAKAAQADGFAEDIRIRVQHGGPEVVGQDDGASGMWAVIGGADQTPDDRAKTHHIEIVAVDDACVECLRFAESNDGEGGLRQSAEFGDGLEVGAEIVDFGDGK